MMKRLISLLLAVVMLLALAACGEEPKETAGTTVQTTTLPPETTLPPATAKSVAEQMTAALKGKIMTGCKAEMDMEFTMSQSSEDMVMTMKMGMTMSMKQSADPLKVYMETNIAMELLGQSVNYGMESYIVMEDGQPVSYTYVPENDTWTKAPAAVENAEELTKPVDYSWLLNKQESELALEEQTQLIDGREVYVLKCTLTGDEMQETMSSTAGLSDSLSDMGLAPEAFADLQVPTVFYVDVQTGIPLKLEMQMEGMDQLMNSLLSQSLGMDPATMGITVEMKPVVMKITEFTVDPVEVPAIPEEAYTAAANAGVYTLEENGEVVQVKPPLGWQEYEVYSDAVTLVNDDNTQLALYIMYADVTGIDFVKEIEDSDVADLKQEKVYINHGMGEDIGSFKTMWVQEEEMMNYYAWGPVGDAYIYVQVLDYTGQTLEAALTPLLDAIVK